MSERKTNKSIRYSHRAKSNRQNLKKNVTIPPARRLTMDSPGISKKSTLPPERLQKVLASVGVDSRRKIEQLISNGEVFVNGKVARLGDKVVAGNVVTIGNVEVTIVEQNHPLPRVIVYHKPEGEVCTRNDPEGRRTVFQSLPNLPNGRWVNVGRLDINTSGLLLFTDDGVLANRLMHPSAEIERHYAVRVLGKVEQEHIDQLTTGVMLDDGMSNFLTLQDLGGEGANHWYRVSLKSGRFREVRRLWETLGFKVSRLIRIQFGDITLPQNLPSGSYQDLSELMVKKMVEAIDMPTKSYTGLYGRGRRLRRNDNQPKSHHSHGDGFKNKSGYGEGNQRGHNRGQDNYNADNDGYSSSNPQHRGGQNRGSNQGGYQGNRNNNQGSYSKDGQRGHSSQGKRPQGNGYQGQNQGGNRQGGQRGNSQGQGGGYQGKGQGGQRGNGGGYQGNKSNYSNNNHRPGHKSPNYKGNNFGRSYDDQSFLGKPEDLYGNGHPHKNMDSRPANGNKSGGGKPSNRGKANRSHSGNRSGGNSGGNRGSS